MTSSATAPPDSNTSASPGRSRGANIALWVGQVLLAALFAFAGMPKLLGIWGSPMGFEAIGLGQWFRYFTGVVELVGAVGLLIPRFAWLAALGLAPVMVGAIIVHIAVLPPAGAAVVPATVLVVLLVIARARRADAAR